MKLHALMALRGNIILNIRNSSFVRNSVRSSEQAAPLRSLIGPGTYTDMAGCWNVSCSAMK